MPQYRVDKLWQNDEQLRAQGRSHYLVTITDERDEVVESGTATKIEVADLLAKELLYAARRKYMEREVMCDSCPAHIGCGGDVATCLHADPAH